jgi:hypothetical protein
MSGLLADAMDLLRLMAWRGAVAGAAAVQRRQHRARQHHRKAESFGAVVSVFPAQHPTAQRARLLAASASFRSCAWDALAHGDAKLAWIARGEAIRHEALARRDRRL